MMTTTTKRTRGKLYEDILPPFRAEDVDIRGGVHHIHDLPIVVRKGNSSVYYLELLGRYGYPFSKLYEKGGIKINEIARELNRAGKEAEISYYRLGMAFSNLRKWGRENPEKRGEIIEWLERNSDEIKAYQDGVKASYTPAEPEKAPPRREVPGVEESDLGISDIVESIDMDRITKDLDKGGRKEGLQRTQPDSARKVREIQYQPEDAFLDFDPDAEYVKKYGWGVSIRNMSIISKGKHSLYEYLMAIYKTGQLENFLDRKWLNEKKIAKSMGDSVKIYMVNNVLRNLKKNADLFGDKYIRWFVRNSEAIDEYVEGVKAGQLSQPVQKPAVEKPVKTPPSISETKTGFKKFRYDIPGKPISDHELLEKLYWVKEDVTVGDILHNSWGSYLDKLRDVTNYARISLRNRLTYLSGVDPGELSRNLKKIRKGFSTSAQTYAKTGQRTRGTKRLRILSDGQLSDSRVLSTIIEADPDITVDDIENGTIGSKAEEALREALGDYEHTIRNRIEFLCRVNPSILEHRCSIIKKYSPAEEKVEGVPAGRTETSKMLSPFKGDDVNVHGKMHYYKGLTVAVSRGRPLIYYLLGLGSAGYKFKHLYSGEINVDEMVKYFNRNSKCLKPVTVHALNMGLANLRLWGLKNPEIRDRIIEWLDSNSENIKDYIREIDTDSNILLELWDNISGKAGEGSGYNPLRAIMPDSLTDYDVLRIIRKEDSHITPDMVANGEIGLEATRALKRELGEYGETANERIDWFSNVRIEELQEAFEDDILYVSDKSLPHKQRDLHTAPLEPDKSKGIVSRLAKFKETKQRMHMPVTVLAEAIQYKIMHMTFQESYNLAENVMNFFGYQDRIIDNVLNPEDRDPFYMLEDNGLLETEREETTLYDGREWRIHYWGLCVRNIEGDAKLLADAIKKAAKIDPKASEIKELDPYDDDPDIWDRSCIQKFSDLPDVIELTSDKHVSLFIPDVNTRYETQLLRSIKHLFENGFTVDAMVDFKVRPYDVADPDEKINNFTKNAIANTLPMIPRNILNVISEHVKGIPDGSDDVYGEEV